MHICEVRFSSYSLLCIGGDWEGQVEVYKFTRNYYEKADTT